MFESLFSAVTITSLCRCIDKVFMEERTEYDTEITCEHSYNKRCAKTLATVYTSQQVSSCHVSRVTTARYRRRSARRTSSRNASSSTARPRPT